DPGQEPSPVTGRLIFMNKLLAHPVVRVGFRFGDTLPALCRGLLTAALRRPQVSSGCAEETFGHQSGRVRRPDHSAGRLGARTVLFAVAILVASHITAFAAEVQTLSGQKHTGE